MKLKTIKQSLTITIPYLVIGSIYIAFSDRFVAGFMFDYETLTKVHTFKGWGFILVTSLLLFILIYRYLNKLESEKANLSESEERWRTLVTNSPDYIALLDQEARFLFVNKYPQGFNDQIIIGTDSIDYFHDEFKALYKEVFNKCLKTRTIQRFEFKAYGDNYSMRDYEEFLVPLLNKRNELTFLAIARDITERITSERTIKESEEKYRTLIENTQEAIYISQDGKIKYANKSAQKISGRTEAEIIDHPITDFVLEEDSDFVREHHRQLISGEIPESQTEFRLLTPSGNIRNLLVNSVLIQWNEKPATLNFGSDITERKRATNELIESEKQLKIAQTIGKIGNWEFDFIMEKFLFSEQMYSLFEREFKDGPLSFDEGLKYFFPEDLTWINDFYSDIKQKGVKWDKDVKMKLPSGKEAWHRSIGESVTDINGRVVKIYGITQDITERKIIELELQRINKFTSDLVQNSGALIYVKDINGKYRLVNKKWEEITGLGRELVFGKSDDDLFSKQDAERFNENDKEVIKSGNTIEVEEILDTVSGPRYFISFKFPTFNENGEIDGVCGNSTEITDRKIAEKALKQSEERFRSIVEGAPDAIFIRADDKFAYLNPSACILFGITNTDELIGTPVINPIHPDYRQITRERMLKIDSNGKQSNQQYELRFLGLDGREGWVETKAEPIIYNGQTSTLVFVRDISSRKKTEDALLASEEKYRSLFENMNEGLAYCKMVFESGIPIDFTYLDVNPRFELLTGLKNIQGKNVSEIIPGIQKDNPGLFDIYGRVSRGGGPESFEEFLPGLNKWFSVSVYSPHFDHFVAVFTVITERKQAEEALRISEERYRTITENIKDVVWIMDTNTGKFLYVSPSVYKLRGYTAEEILNQPVNAALTEESVELLNKITVDRINKYLTTGVSEYYIDEIEQPCKDGSTVWTEVVTSFYLNEKTGHIEVRGVSRDINERKMIQDALRESEERLRNTLDNMLEGCQILDSNLNYIYINDAAEKQNRRPKSHLLGNNYQEMWPGIEETYVFKVIKNCAKNRILHQFENEFIYPDGTIGWFDLSIHPVKEGVFILSIDITERKKAELAILESREQLRALASGLEKVREEERIYLSRELHDHLGQNLTGLKMDVAFISKLIEANKPFNKKNIAEKTRGMSELIDELIQNVRKISSELRPNVLDYLGLVPAIEWQVEEFRKRTEIECSYSSNTAKIDLGMQINSSIFRIIQEAFTNIVRHSKATKVDISLDEQDDHISIKISDNGIGIKENELSDIKSLGILGMKERTLNFKGKLDIVNKDSGGTILTLIIPKEIKND